MEIAVQNDGRAAVAIWRVESQHRVFNQPFDEHLRDARSLSFRPGTYVLEIACWRPGATTIVDGEPEFAISVRAEERYRLDCAPASGDDNHYSLSKLSP